MTTKKAYASVPRRREPLGLNTFRELIEKMETERPDIPVFTYLNYRSGELVSVMPRDFRMQTEGLGTWLYESGKNRKIIGILGGNSYEWLLAFFGAQYGGCVVLLLDHTAGSDILKDQIVRSGCKDLLYSSADSSAARALAEETGMEIYAFEDLAEYAAKGREMIGQQRRGCLEQTLCGDDMAVIMYTSGTTGISKGVMLSSKNLLFNCDCTGDLIETRMDQIHFLPLNHIYAILAMLTALTAGRSLHICLNMRRMLADFETAKPEMLFLVPLIVKTLYSLVWQGIRKQGDEDKVRKMILENSEKGDVSYEDKRKMFAPYLKILGGRLKKLFSGGAPIDVNLIRGFEDLGIPVQEGYGITECSPALAFNPDERVKVGTVGMVLPGHEIMIENPDENGNGEICAKGPSVMLGYYNMEKETAEALAGGWFHTGDKGFLDEDNYLTIVGRIKNLIILSNGENISPEELEAKLYLCKAISEVVVYEKDDKIAAMVYPDQEYISNNNIADGEEFIRDFINAYNLTASATKKINKVHFRDIPFEKTSSKKIKRTFEHI